MRRISASEFKAKCLTILDLVAKSGERFTILKRGRVVARLIPPAGYGKGHPQHHLKGTATILGDIISPSKSVQEWESAGER